MRSSRWRSSAGMLAKPLADRSPDAAAHSRTASASCPRRCEAAGRLEPDRHDDPGAESYGARQRGREVGRRLVERPALDLDPGPVGERVRHLHAVAELAGDLVRAIQRGERVVEAVEVESQQAGVVEPDGDPLPVTRSLPDRTASSNAPAAASGRPASRSTSPRFVRETASEFSLPRACLSARLSTNTSRARSSSPRKW